MVHSEGINTTVHISTPTNKSILTRDSDFQRLTHRPINSKAAIEKQAHFVNFSGPQGNIYYMNFSKTWLALLNEPIILCRMAAQCDPGRFELLLHK